MLYVRLNKIFRRRLGAVPFPAKRATVGVLPPPLSCFLRLGFRVIGLFRRALCDAVSIVEPDVEVGRQGVRMLRYLIVSILVL